LEEDLFPALEAFGLGVGARLGRAIRHGFGTFEICAAFFELGDVADVGDDLVAEDGVELVGEGMAGDVDVLELGEAGEGVGGLGGKAAAVAEGDDLKMWGVLDQDVDGVVVDADIFAVYLREGGDVGKHPGEVASDVPADFEGEELVVIVEGKSGAAALEEVELEVGFFGWRWREGGIRA
jgi:hypothetical protein